MFEFRIPYPHYISAAPDLLMALTFLATWIDPTALGNHMINYLVLIMLMEFITIHSSAFFGAVLISNVSKGKKVFSLLGLGAFYTMFVAAFSLSSGEWWPIVAFWGLIFNRLMSVVLGKSPDGKQQVSIMAMWVIGTICYLGGVFITALAPVPELGVTYEYVQSLHIAEHGLWFDEPHRLIAFGFLYFTLISFAELNISQLTGWIKPSGFDNIKSQLFR